MLLEWKPIRNAIWQEEFTKRSITIRLSSSSICCFLKSIIFFWRVGIRRRILSNSKVVLLGERWSRVRISRNSLGSTRFDPSTSKRLLLFQFQSKHLLCIKRKGGWLDSGLLDAGLMLCLWSGSSSCLRLWSSPQFLCILGTCGSRSSLHFLQSLYLCVWES